MVPSTRWFVNEDGSTILASMLAVLLTCTMLATGLQWYWVSASSGDIQSVADLGALAGADAIAKTVTVIQVLDFVLLAMNVTALVLHVIVAVSGVVVVSSAPAGGTSMLPLFEKALDFDRKFIDLRKRFADEAFRVSTALSDAAPYLAMGQSYRVVKSNASALASRGGASMLGTVIPFPARGAVTLSSMPTNERELTDSAGAANQQNTADAERLEKLERQLEAARLRCWDEDVFRSASTPYYGWNPATAIDDFDRALAELRDAVPDADLPRPASGSNWSTDVLRQQYELSYAEVGEAIALRFSRAARDAAGGYLSPGDVTPSYLLEPASSEVVYVVAHDPSERKAYHEALSCSGLSNAGSTPLQVALRELVGDTDHPPCSLCTPTHWSAVQQWDATLAQFAAAWNGEAAAIRGYESIREEIDGLKEGLTSRTTAVLDELLDSASAYLKGGRLTYCPAGSRGLVCVVITTESPVMPAFTLPALTGANQRLLGRQIALAGATLSQGGGESAAAQAVARISSDVGIGRTSYLSGSVVTTLGLSDGVSGALGKLWQSAVTMLNGQPSSLRGTFDALPWGMDILVRNFLDSVIELAGVTKPDTRQVIPVLSAVASIGDPSESGMEGQFARAVRSAHDAYGAAGDLAAAAESLVGVGVELYGGAATSLVSTASLRLLGKAFRIPFDEWSVKDGQNAAGFAASGLRAALGGP